MRGKKSTKPLSVYVQHVQHTVSQGVSSHMCHPQTFPLLNTTSIPIHDFHRYLSKFFMYSINTFFQKKIFNHSMPCPSLLRARTKYGHDEISTICDQEEGGSLLIFYQNCSLKENQKVFIDLYKWCASHNVMHGSPDNNILNLIIFLMA